MVAKSLLENVLALPVSDQLDLLSQLQDHLQYEAAAASLSDEDRQILDQRIDDAEQNPGVGSTWPEVEARLRARITSK